MYMWCVSIKHIYKDVSHRLRDYTIQTYRMFHNRVVTSTTNKNVLVKAGTSFYDFLKSHHEFSSLKKYVHNCEKKQIKLLEQLHKK